jgi:hypothetical protein
MNWASTLTMRGFFCVIEGGWCNAENFYYLYTKVFKFVSKPEKR